MITAQALGHSYCAITDHSPRLKVARGLSAERLREQQEVITDLNEALAPFRVLRGIEVDILEDGGLDQEDGLLAELDVVVSSVHSKLRSDSETMTHRMVAGIANPRTNVLGHCTGRLIEGERGLRPQSTLRRRGGLRSLPEFRRGGGDQLPTRAPGSADRAAAAGDGDGLPVLHRHRRPRARPAGVPDLRLRAGRVARPGSGAGDQHLAGRSPASWCAKTKGCRLTARLCSRACAAGPGRVFETTAFVGSKASERWGGARPSASGASHQIGSSVDDETLAATLVTEAGALATTMLAAGLETRLQDLGVRRGVRRPITRPRSSWWPGCARNARTTVWSGRRAPARPGDRTWFIDPVDGTYNFLSGIPYWCSAVGLVDADGPLLGAVFYPAQDQLWVGGRNRPTTLNGEPVPGAHRRRARRDLGGHLLPSPASPRCRPGGRLAGGGLLRRYRTDARLGLDRPRRSGQRPARGLPAGQPASVGLVPRSGAGARCRRRRRSRRVTTATTGRSPATLEPWPRRPPLCAVWRADDR